MLHDLLGSIDADHFEKDYRQAVIRNLDLLQLFGTDVSAASRRHRLSVAYISLLVERTGHLVEIIEEEKPVVSEDGFTSQNKVTRKIRAYSSEYSSDESIRDVVSVDKALEDSRCLLIRGPLV